VKNITQNNLQLQKPLPNLALQRVRLVLHALVHVFVWLTLRKLLTNWRMFGKNTALNQQENTIGKKTENSYHWRKIPSGTTTLVKSTAVTLPPPFHTSVLPKVEL